MDGDAGILRILHELIDILNRNGIDLVVDIDALHILAISLDSIDQVFNIIVTVELDMAIVDLVLLHDALDHTLIDLSQLHSC